MINKILIMTLIIFGSCLSSHAQMRMEEADAKNELRIALSDTTVHNVVNSKTLIIKDKGTAINVVEPILFSIYGKENIIMQRPYEIYFIDNYWIISGTLPKGDVGGTFMIIIDARNSKIIRLTHGK